MDEGPSNLRIDVFRRQRNEIFLSNLTLARSKFHRVGAATSDLTRLLFLLLFVTLSAIHDYIISCLPPLKIPK